MKSDTQAITIEVDRNELFDFISNPENLAKWATGFCKGIHQDDEQWIVETSMGDVKLRCVSDKELGVVDYYLIPPLPIKVVVHSRILPNGKGSEFIFTQFQIPFMPDGAFERQKEKAAEQLSALKEMMENR